MIKTFIQGVSHVAPTCTHLFLHEILIWFSWHNKTAPQAIRDITLSTLTYKVVFLVAITSAWHVFKLMALSYKEPFHALHKDKGVLKG